MPTIIKGQPTSAEIRKRLKAEGRPVVLSCSLGKDSLAAWVALEDEGIEVVSSGPSGHLPPQGEGFSATNKK